MADSLRQVLLLRQQLRFQWVRNMRDVAHGLHDPNSPCDGIEDMDVIVRPKHFTDRTTVGNAAEAHKLKKKEPIMNSELAIANTRRLVRLGALLFLVSSWFLSTAAAQAPADVPIVAITPEGSSVTFFVKASVKLEGTFAKWDANLTFTSTDVTTGVLTITIAADSVSTGSGMKDGKLKSKDFFNVAEDPTITFKSTKLAQTGPGAFEIDGDFTIRGVTKPEKLVLKYDGNGTGAGTINGTMAFDRKDYGMNKGIPLVKIADRVEVTVNLKVKHISGPYAVYQH